MVWVIQDVEPQHNKRRDLGAFLASATVEGVFLHDDGVSRQGAVQAYDRIKAYAKSKNIDMSNVLLRLAQNGDKWTVAASLIKPATK